MHEEVLLEIKVPQRDDLEMDKVIIETVISVEDRNLLITVDFEVSLHKVSLRDSIIKLMVVVIIL